MAHKPVAVLISDVHYNVHTLPLADAAMRQAIAKANDLNIPLIIAGDLHDTKANLRGECVKAMIETFKLSKTDCYVLVGNHDKINEKSEDHSLTFLEAYCNVIQEPHFSPSTKSYLLPYYHDVAQLKIALSFIPKGSRIIMHQGVEGSNMGDYVQDKSALQKDDLADYRVISGHYHARQDIKCGRPRAGAIGLFSYIGNPYTLGFGEAADPGKGFRLLMEDGTLEFIPTNLARHQIVICGWDDRHELFWGPILALKAVDKVWFKVKGTSEQLAKVTKQWITKELQLKPDFDFKLELIPEIVETEKTSVNLFSAGETLDIMIDSLSNTSLERKEKLKQLWRNSCN